MIGTTVEPFSKLCVSGQLRRGGGLIQGVQSWHACSAQEQQIAYLHL